MAASPELDGGDRPSGDVELARYDPRIGPVGEPGTGQLRHSKGNGQVVVKAPTNAADTGRQVGLHLRLLVGRVIKPVIRLQHMMLLQFVRAEDVDLQQITGGKKW